MKKRPNYPMVDLSGLDDESTKAILEALAEEYGVHVAEKTKAKKPTRV